MQGCISNDIVLSSLCSYCILIYTYTLGLDPRPLDQGPTEVPSLSTNETIGVLGHDSALKGYTGSGTVWANEMKFVMNHDLGYHHLQNSALHDMY